MSTQSTDVTSHPADPPSIELSGTFTRPIDISMITPINALGK